MTQALSPVSSNRISLCSFTRPFLSVIHQKEYHDHALHAGRKENRCKYASVSGSQKKGKAYAQLIEPFNQSSALLFIFLILLHSYILWSASRTDFSMSPSDTVNIAMP